MNSDFFETEKVKRISFKYSHMFQMKGMKYKLIGTMSTIAPNGGYIAITNDKTVGASNSRIRFQVWIKLSRTILWFMTIKEISSARWI